MSDCQTSACHRLCNSDDHYGSLAIFFHWTTSILIIALLACGFAFQFMPRSVIGTVMPWHKLFGIIVFFLAIVRALWANINTRPSLNEVGCFERIAARTLHLLLYAGIILMPLSGWMMASASGRGPFGLNIPGVPISKAMGGMFSDLHEILAWVLLAMVILHIFAGLKHHFVNKNDILKKMLPRK